MAAAINNGDDADATINFTIVIPAKGKFDLDDELYIKDNDDEMKEYKISNISEVAYELTPVNDDDGEKVTVTFDCTKTGIHPIYTVDISGKSHDLVEVSPNPNEVDVFEIYDKVFAIPEDDSQYVRITSIIPVEGDDSKFKCKIYGGKKKSKLLEVETIFVDVNSSGKKKSSSNNSKDKDDDKEPTLEDGANSGCNKCKKQLQTGKKERTNHNKECPLSSQSIRERKAGEKKKSSSNNSKDKDDDELSGVEPEVINGDGQTRAQRVTNRDSRNNSTSGNNLGRAKNSRLRDKSPTSNSSKDRTTKPAAKKQKKQTGGNANGGAAAATAVPPVSIGNDENTPRNQNGITSHGIGRGGGSGQGGGAGLVDSTLRGSISTSNSGSGTSNGLSTMDIPPNPDNMLYVEIERGVVSDDGQTVDKCWVNMETKKVQTNRPSPCELQARLSRALQVTVQPQQPATRGMIQQQGQTNMMMPPQQFDMEEMMQQQQMMQQQVQQQMMMMMMNQQMNQQMMQQMQQMGQQQPQQQQQPQAPGLLSLLRSILSWIIAVSI